MNISFKHLGTPSYRELKENAKEPDNLRHHFTRDTKIPLDDIVYAKYIEKAYYVKTTYGVKYWWWILSQGRKQNFESQFPFFPYRARVEDYTTNQVMKKVTQKLDAIDARIDAVVSHLETVMVALGQRKATDDPLDI